MISKLLNLFQSKNNKEEATINKSSTMKQQSNKSIRKGELGEYKVNIQLDQMPQEYKHLSDLLLPNLKAKSGFSQIDHILLTSYAVFIIETKSYLGEVIGGREDKQWSVNNRFMMMNPFYQNYGHVESTLKQINVTNKDIVSLVSFTRRCTFSVDPELRKIGSNQLIVYDIELTEFIHRKINRIKETTKEPRFTAQEIESMYAALMEANITDSIARKSHLDGLKQNCYPVQQKYDYVDGKCASCGKPVTDKVKEYCLSNQSKFKGKVYCFDHQKSLC